MRVTPRLPGPLWSSTYHAAPRIDFQRGSLNDLRRQHRRGTDGHDLVVIAVQNECWHVELLEIFGEIRLGKRLDAVEHGVVASHAMTEDHRLSRTPVLVVNLCAVLCRDYADKISPWFFSAANCMDG